MEWHVSNSPFTIVVDTMCLAIKVQDANPARATQYPNSLSCAMTKVYIVVGDGGLWSHLRRSKVFRARRREIYLRYQLRTSPLYLAYPFDSS